MSEAPLEARRAAPPRSAVDQDEIDLAEYLAIIWRHRWMIVVFCVISVAVVVPLTLRKPLQYCATATIIPPVTTLQKEPGLAGGLGRMGSSMLRSVIDTGSVADIYIEILKSREVAGAIIDRFDLMNAYKGVMSRSDARARLQGNTKIEASKEGSVRISVTDTDPNLCAAVAKAYIEELDKQNKRLSSGEATSKRVFLENEVKEKETKLSQIDNMLSRDAKVQEMLYETLVQELEMAKIEEAKNMPTIQVLDRVLVPELPLSRGTARKGMMAATAAFMAGIFVAFTHEYAVDMRRRRLSRVSTGRYDIELPDAKGSDLAAPSSSKDSVSLDQARQTSAQGPSTGS